METQQAMEQVMQPEVREVVIGGFAIVLELKPERIQDPVTAQDGIVFGYQIGLSGTATQPVTFELAEPKLTIQIFGETATIA